MIDQELMRDQLDELRRRAERGAEVRRLLAGTGDRPVLRRASAARSALGLGIARVGLWLAGAYR
jgi:phosphatidylserine/phosphatidylglycerophosphate/cardiolipin synthase-like enzyme